MSSRRRITIALVGLIVLVVVGWLVRGATGADSAELSKPAVSVAATGHGADHHEFLVVDDG